MKLGYPCTNTTLTCSASKTFRLKNYTGEKLSEVINANLSCLREILEFNVERDLLFFRISSNTIPFASHQICQFYWEDHFKNHLESIGCYIKQHDMRISMHPGQFVLLNSPKQSVIENSIRELEWHCRFLDALALDATAKVQIHLGGVYGDKKRSVEKFVSNFDHLSKFIKKRLVIENDDYSYSLQDCLAASEKTEIPIVFDTLHHTCLNNGESILEALELAQETWKEKDGILMVDYSSQNPKGRKGAHAETIDLTHFDTFIKTTQKCAYDLMLEIKDKEKSAIKAINMVRSIYQQSMQ